MIDVNQLKATVEMLTFIKHDTELKRKATSGGGEYAGPCPFCGGKDRFHVQPNHERGGRWLCRGCTNGKWQDVIAYIMRRESVSFIEACRRLAGPGSVPVDFASRKTARRQATTESDSQRSQRSNPLEQWQARARKFVQDSEHLLWTPAGEKARNYLHARGLREDTLRRWHIGFNPEEKYASHKSWGLPEVQDGTKHRVWLPVGVVIPCEVDGKFWYVKIRRAKDDPKYINIKGGTPALFGTHTLHDHDTAVLCEGEFDCILLNQEAGDLIGAATLGSASSTDINLRIWGKYLLPVGKFLIAYDSDAAGEKGTRGLSSLSARMQPVAVPKIKTGDKD